MQRRSFVPLTVSTFAALALLAAVGCGRSREPPTGMARQSLASLTPLAGCGEVANAIREAAIADMNASIDTAIAETEASTYPESCVETADAGASSGSPAPGNTPPPSAPPTSGGATSVSTTNNQVAGVDEADFIKNDAKYIYAVAGGAFHVIDAWPAASAHEVAKIPLEGTPKKLFVQGDRALVYVAMPKTPRGSSSGGGWSPSPWGNGESCTYGYDCDVTGDGTATRVLVYDLTNRAAPTLVRQVDLSGALIAARRIGNTVHTVVTDDVVRFPGVALRLDGYTPCIGPYTDADKAEIIAKLERLRAKNEAIIRATDVTTDLPHIQDSLGLAGAGQCHGFYKANTADGQSFTSLVSLDMTARGAIESSTIVSRPGTVYASGTSLYMAVRHERTGTQPWFDGRDTDDEVSTIHKFQIGDTPSWTAYLASGTVKGRALNQFSMDEYNGNLRVATTSGHLPSPDAENTMTVLSQAESALRETGKVGGIARGEDIRSVRFDGDRGFMVTFKKTDPLYVFDLSNAAAPAILGELEIPGFSTYMHMMDATHLLTIGYDADDQGDFAWFAGVLMQIFDVTDPANPKLAWKNVIATRGSSSEALADHLAFNYFAPKSLLALPMTICEGGSGGSYGTDLTFSGLMVFDVTTSTGFHERGRVAHPIASTGGDRNAACTQWWANAGSEVKRSIFMDDFVYSISESVIKVEDLGHMGTDVASIPIGP